MTLTMYRATASAYRHTRRVLHAQPHDCLWAAASTVKALRPDLDDDDALQEAAKAIRWVGANYRNGCGAKSNGMSDGGVQTEAVTISDTLMIVRITLAIHTRGIPTPYAHEALVPPCEGLLAFLCVDDFPQPAESLIDEGLRMEHGRNICAFRVACVLHGMTDNGLQRL